MDEDLMELETENKVHYKYSELLSRISEEIDEDPVEFLNGILFSLKILGQQDEIKLYKMVFVDNITEVDNAKLGCSFVQDTLDFDEDKIKFLYNNAKFTNHNLEKDDYFIVTVITPTNNIDFNETLEINVSNPWESEVIIKDPNTIKIISVE